jgi:hypothetical protein
MVAHPVDDAVEFGLLGQPVPVELGHHRERPVEEAQRAVGVELRCARGHPVGKLALRFDVARKLGPRVLEVLDVDREARDRAGRKRHVDDPKHPPFAVDDRRLHPRHDAASLLGLARGFERAVFSLGVDQLGRTLDYVGGIARLDRMDERAVDQPEPEVGPAIPHRERRSLDQVRQRVERGLGLAKPKSEPGAFLGTGAHVEEPQEQGPRGLGRGSRPAAHVEHPRRPVQADLARHFTSGSPRGSDVGGKRFQILRGDSAAFAMKVGNHFRRRFKAELADQQRIAFNPSIGPHDQRPRRRDFE